MRKTFAVFVSLIFLFSCLPMKKNLCASQLLHRQIKTVGFLPLDTRPCTYDFPVELGQLYGAKLIYPDKDILTNFRDEPNIEAVRSWLVKTADECDALVVSVEQLVYGGLIQAREAKEDESAALDLLRDIKRSHPDMPIYLSNVLMRTSTTAFDEESLEWWQKISDYSNAYYRARVNNDEAAKFEIAEIENEIPKKVLDTFLKARRLNHELNLKCIQLVEDGIADRLQICQEDSSAEGMQRLEQEKLIEAAPKSGCSNKITMANGTDEAGAELLMQMLCPEGADAQIVWLGENTNFSDKYEDRPFIKNLLAHMKAMNIKEALDSKNVIFVFPPKAAQGDYAMNSFDGYEAYSDEEINSMVQIICEFIQQGKHVFLLDVDSANGGNAELLIALAQKIPILNLYGYSAWNTASNSLGTLLAQLLACGGENTLENQCFTAERIIDDCVYQSVLRQAAIKNANEMQINPMDIENTHISFARQLLSDVFVQNEDLLQKIFGQQLPHYQIDFRWPRFFEIAVRVSTQ